MKQIIKNSYETPEFEEVKMEMQATILDPTVPTDPDDPIDDPIDE